MRLRWLAILCLAGSAFGAVGGTTIYEVDNTTQTDRYVTYGMVFKDGDIATCAQPLIDGTPTANYQNDRIKRWASGKLKFAEITLKLTLTALAHPVITYQNTATCNDTGGLSVANISAGTWDGQIEVTAGGSTFTSNIKTAISSLSVGDMQLELLADGTQMTQLRVRDLTSARSLNFGWHLTGGTMTGDPGNSNLAYTANCGGASPCYASLSPTYVLTFYGGDTSKCKIDFIMENMWYDRIQEQDYSFVIKTGSGLTTVYNSTSDPASTAGVIKHYNNSRWRKTFWSGTAPDHVRWSHSPSYLMSTEAIPKYDTSDTLSPDTATDANAGIVSYTTWTGTQKGDVAAGCHDAQQGFYSFGDCGYSNNSEYAPIEREDLYLLYNTDCGTGNGACAKAWQMLTGRSSDGNTTTSAAIDTTVGANDVPGGAGVWNYMGNIPYHSRSVSANNFYYSSYDPAVSPDSTYATAASGGSGTAYGRSLSRHAQTTGGWVGSAGPNTAIGDVSLGGWTIECSHPKDYSYFAYLYTADSYYQDEMFQWASWCPGWGTNPDNADGDGLAWAALSNPGDASTRTLAGGSQALAHAAFIAEDGSTEKSAYTAMLNANAVFEEGWYTLTTDYAPTTRHANCSGWTRASTNVWDFGRCQYNSTGVVPALHSPVNGFCWQGESYNTPVHSVTAATSANPSVLTVDSTTNFNYLAVWGATNGGVGQDWTIINGLPAFTISSGTQLSLTSVNAVGVTQPLTGTVYASGTQPNQNVATDWQEQWMNSFATIGARHICKMGYSAWCTVADEMGKAYVEIVSTSGSNPWLILGSYEIGYRGGAGTCTGSTPSSNPFFTTWADVVAAFVNPLQSVNTFNSSFGASGLWNPLPAGDHGYSVTAYGALAMSYAVTSTCNGNSCNGATSWDWGLNHIPMMNHTVSGSTSAGNDYGVKFDFLPYASDIANGSYISPGVLFSSGSVIQ